MAWMIGPKGEAVQPAKHRHDDAGGAAHAIGDRGVADGGNSSIATKDGLEFLDGAVIQAAYPAPRLSWYV
jgi:hypothetical protein